MFKGLSAAKKAKIVRRVMNRAHAIAKNSMNAHNSNPKTVARLGAVSGIKELFAESLKIAWQEEKTNTVIYQNVKDLPRKVMPRIQIDVKTILKVTKELVNKGELLKEEANYRLAITSMSARYGRDKVTEEMKQEVRNIAYANFSDDVSVNYSGTQLQLKIA